MVPTDNLMLLHKFEEDLRAKSLASIEGDLALSDHWNLAGEAMNAIYAFTHDRVHGSGNEQTLQYLGVRLFNAAAASAKLALSGYYQKAFHQMRDVLETSFLVDYLVLERRRNRFASLVNAQSVDDRASPGYGAYCGRRQQERSVGTADSLNRRSR